MALGQLVYDRRTELGLTEDGLAARLGVTADDVEHIEVGGVLRVTSELLLRLAAALDVSVDVHLASSGSEVSFVARAA
jgi:transcriptional regulator with XRE-family HTH domain